MTLLIAVLLLNQISAPWWAYVLTVLLWFVHIYQHATTPWRPKSSELKFTPTKQFCARCGRDALPGEFMHGVIPHAQNFCGECFEYVEK